MKYENIVKCQFSTKTEREMHFHQDIEILYVLDGSLEVEYEDGTHFLKYGSVHTGEFQCPACLPYRGGSAARKPVH